MASRKKKTTNKTCPTLPGPVGLSYAVITFDYIPQPQGDRVAGLWVGSDNAVLVDSKLKGPDLVRVILHELLHAMWAFGEIKEADSGEEHSVSVLSNQMTELFCRNPHLLIWIAENL